MQVLDVKRRTARDADEHALASEYTDRFLKWEVAMDTTTRIRQAKVRLIAEFHGEGHYFGVYLGYEEWMELTTHAEYRSHCAGVLSHGAPWFDGMPIYRVAQKSHFNVAELKPMM